MIQKKRYYIILLALILAIGSLTACSQANKQDSSQEVVKEESAEEKTAKIYGEILDKIEDYDFLEIEELSPEDVEYTYALVYMIDENNDNNQKENEDKEEIKSNNENKNKNAEQVQMLVAKDGGLGLSNLKVFSYDLEEEEIITPDNVIITGVAGAGGFRGSLSQLEEEVALEYVSFMSGTGATTVEHIKLEESELVENLVWEGRIDNLPNDRSLLEIDWIPIMDRSKLEKLAKGEKQFNKEIQPEVEEKEQLDERPGHREALIEKEKEAGMVVLEGVIQKMTYQEILELQKESDPNPDNSDLNEEYYIFLLTNPQELSLRSAGGPGFSEGRVEIIRIDQNEGISNYSGKNVSLSIDPSGTYWPSDTSLPLGQPSTDSFKVIE